MNKTQNTMLSKNTQMPKSTYEWLLFTEALKQAKLIYGVKNQNDHPEWGEITG